MTTMMAHHRMSEDAARNVIFFCRWRQLFLIGVFLPVCVRSFFARASLGDRFHFRGAEAFISFLRHRAISHILTGNSRSVSCVFFC